MYTTVHDANCMRAAARHGVKSSCAIARTPSMGWTSKGKYSGPSAHRSWVSFAIPRATHDDRRARTALQRAFGIGAELHVVPLEGWRPPMYYDEPACRGSSPPPTCRRSTPRSSTGARALRGDGAIGGTGDDEAFGLIGAPWIDGEELAAAMNGRGCRRALPAGLLRADLQKHAKTTCGAADPRDGSPCVQAGPHRRRARRRVPSREPRPVCRREPPYEYEHQKQRSTFSLRLGAAAQTLATGGDAASVTSTWAVDEDPSAVSVTVSAVPG